MTAVTSMGFEEFVDYLFSFPSPPDPDTLRVDAVFEDSSPGESAQSEMLYMMFVGGFRKKYADVPLTDLNEKHFETVRDYIRALGYETTLHGYELDENGVIERINISFAPYINPGNSVHSIVN